AGGTLSFDLAPKPPPKGQRSRITGSVLTCRLILMLVLTVGFFVAELASGYLGNSIALVSDSFNMLSDLISLCVGLSTGLIARRSRRGPRATYGYSRAEAVGALSNAVFLTALCFTIFVEAIRRLARPEPIDDARLVLIVGTLGLAVNLVGLLVFQDWGDSSMYLDAVIFSRRGLVVWNSIDNSKIVCC
uniref:Cation efflux protein transmembrane domain-containing protein n=1 Tax=Aquila chrysaetos chrysaetos TaxID=223781 RepID=A0A663FAG4_AQUCH